MAVRSDLECSWSSFILWEISTQYYTNDVILSTVNAFTAVLALLGNLAIVVATRKNSILTPYEILIGSLALVDCFAALVARPLFIALRLSLHQDHVTCFHLWRLTKATESAILLCVGCSFMHMVLIAADRYFALRKPITYRTPRGKKVAGRVLCACWVIWSFIAILAAFIPRSFQFLRVFMATVLLTSLVFFKVKTSLIVHRFSHSVVQNNNSVDVQRLATRDRKVLVDTKFTLVAFMVLFIPTCVLSVVRPGGLYGNAMFPWLMTITLLTSTINPIIHLWRNRKLRKEIVNLFWPCK